MQDVVALSHVGWLVLEYELNGKFVFFFFLNVCLNVLCNKSDAMDFFILLTLSFCLHFIWP